MLRNSKAIAGEKKKKHRRLGCRDRDFMKICSFFSFCNLNLYVWWRSLTTSSCIISDTVENSTHVRNYKPPACFGNSDHNFTGAWLRKAPALCFVTYRLAAVLDGPFHSCSTHFHSTGPVALTRSSLLEPCIVNHLLC